MLILNQAPYIVVSDPLDTLSIQMYYTIGWFQTRLVSVAGGSARPLGATACSVRRGSGTGRQS
jgi:hypothetical protein